MLQEWPDRLEELQNFPIDFEPATVISLSIK